MALRIGTSSVSHGHRIEMIKQARVEPEWLEGSDVLFEQWMIEVLPQSSLAKREKSARTETCLLLATGVEIHRLNHEFRGVDRETNVLAFPNRTWVAEDQVALGDLVICPKVVRREARAQGKVPRAHFLHLLLHGMLHLLGFDHVTSRQAAVMESREIAMLERLGIPNPYAEAVL